MKKLLILCLLSCSSVVFSMDPNQFLENNNVSVVFNTFTNRTNNSIEIKNRNEQVLLVIPPQSSVQWNEPVAFNNLFNFGLNFFINFENVFKITGWLNDNPWVIIVVGVDFGESRFQEVNAAIRQVGTIEDEIDLNGSIKQQSDEYVINVLFGKTREDSSIYIHEGICTPQLYGASGVE